MSNSFFRKAEDRLGLSILSFVCLGLVVFLGIKFAFRKEQPNYGLTEREAVFVFRHPLAGIRLTFHFEKKQGCRCKSFIRGSVFSHKKHLADFVLLIYRDGGHTDMHWRERNSLSAYRYELEGGSQFTNYVFALNKKQDDIVGSRERAIFLRFSQDVQLGLDGETNAPFEV